MPVLTIFKLEKSKDVQEIVHSLDGKNANGCTISAQKSNYTDSEVFIQYFHKEDIEDCISRAYSDGEAEEIYSFLKENGRTMVVKRTICFINIAANTLEVYRWKDGRTEEIVAVLEKLLDTAMIPITVKPEGLRNIYSSHATELSQAMFKNVEGLIYDVFRGRQLESNRKFREYEGRFLESLRVISFRPRIRFLNGNNRYQVTINGDKGTVRFSDQCNGFSWRPRYEVRQVTFMIASILGESQGMAASFRPDEPRRRALEQGGNTWTSR